ncbi:hypothetical protein GJAV_G00061740 [Gymnothorax javanicus]|nr:hypothetical protein GJAV_G00061740 [Gymnothorax javanicus]
MSNSYVLQRTRAPFERFQDGLCSCGLLDAVRPHPTIFKENEAVCHWRDYLLNAEMGLCNVTLEDILILATGSDSVPALGFDSPPTLKFLHDSSTFPEANTCSNIPKIPFKESYEHFIKDMVFGIKNSPGFGIA